MVPGERDTFAAYGLDARDDLLIGAVLLYHIQVDAQEIGEFGHGVTEAGNRFQQNFGQHDSRTDVEQDAAVRERAHRRDEYSEISEAGLAVSRAVCIRVHVYDIGADGHLRPSAAQEDLVMEDQYWGAPGASAVKHESDILIGKPGTDLLVIGDACAPGDHLV